MSDLAPSGQIPSGRHIGWGWFVALGIVLIAIGIVAWIDVVAFTLAGTIFIGAMLLVGGGFQIVHAFMTRGWSGMFFNLLIGILYVIGGLLIMGEPIQGALVITLFVAAALVIGGIVRIAFAIRHRHMRGWGFFIAGGIISVLVGIMLYATLPWSGLWVLGTLIAVELIIHGMTWLQLGLALRKGAHP